MQKFGYEYQALISFPVNTELSTRFGVTTSHQMSIGQTTEAVFLVMGDPSMNEL